MSEGDEVEYDAGAGIEVWTVVWADGSVAQLMNAYGATVFVLISELE